MSAHEQLGVLAQVRALSGYLDPLAFGAKLDELRRGSLPRTSLPAGARSSERPDPETDSLDRALAYTETSFRVGLNQALAGLRRCERAQRGLLSAMGCDINDRDDDTARQAMRDARQAATQIIDESKAEKDDKFFCDVCRETKKRTDTQRPRSARIDALPPDRRVPKPKACSACYQYGAEHPGAPTPPEVVLRRRLEKELAEQRRHAG